jgi:DNA phosphorothioation-dependent restriction protein DptH
VRPDLVRRSVEELKLRLALPEDFTPRSYIDRGAVVFEIPKSDDQRYFVSAEDVWARSQFTMNALYAPFGEDIRGNVVGIDFSSSDSPHLLIAGQTGSGKSIALETILLGLARHYPPDRLRMLLVDPKMTELARLERDPHLLEPIGYGADDARRFLESAVEEMQRRRELFREVGARTLPEYNVKVHQDPAKLLPWHLIVLDEYADLAAEKEDKKAIEAELQRLAQKARASGIHIVVATQRPSADVLSSVIRANLPAQLALRVRSGTESHIVMAETGAETLAGKGDAFFKTARMLVRVQCAKVD